MSEANTAPEAVEFVRACASADLAEGKCDLVTVHGTQVQLFRVNGEVRALDNVCPHAGAPVNCALWDGEAVTCTYHGLRFQVPSGEGMDAPGWSLETYPVKEAGGEVFVKVPHR